MDLGKGLGSDEVQKRPREYGYNEVPRKKLSPAIRFVKKFWGITPWMLEVTILLEWILEKYLETYVVIGLLVFNAISGFLQEERANSALELLLDLLQKNGAAETVYAEVSKTNLTSLWFLRKLGFEVSRPYEDSLMLEKKVLNIVGEPPSKKVENVYINLFNPFEMGGGGLPWMDD
jgi:hypothetical protein